MKKTRKYHRKVSRKHSKVYSKEKHLLVRYAVLGGLAGAGLFTIIGLPFVYHFDHGMKQAFSFLLVFGGLVGALCGLNAAWEKTKKIKFAALTFFHKLI